MKVREIVSINEQSLKTTIASAVFGPAAKLLAKVLGKGDKKATIEALTQFADSTGKINVNSLTGPDQAVVNAAISKYGPNIVTKAETLVKRNIRNTEFKANVSVISQSIKNASNFISSAASWGIDAAVYAVMIPPINEYLSMLERGEAAVNAGKWSEEQFDSFRKQQMAILVGKLTTQLMTKKLTSLVIGKIPLLGGLIQDLKGDKIAQAYFMNWVNTQEGSEAVATVIGDSVMNGPAGAGGTWAEDKIRSMIPLVKEYSATKSTQEKQPVAAQPAPIEKPSVKTPMPSTAPAEKPSDITWSSEKLL